MGEVKFKLVLPISYVHASPKHSILELLFSFYFKKEGYSHVILLVSKGGQIPLLNISLVKERTKVHLGLFGDVIKNYEADDDCNGRQPLEQTMEGFFHVTFMKAKVENTPLRKNFLVEERAKGQNGSHDKEDHSVQNEEQPMLHMASFLNALLVLTSEGKLPYSSMGEVFVVADFFLRFLCPYENVIPLSGIYKEKSDGEEKDGQGLSVHLTKALMLEVWLQGSSSSMFVCGMVHFRDASLIERSPAVLFPVFVTDNQKSGAVHGGKRADGGPKGGPCSLKENTLAQGQFGHSAHSPTAEYYPDDIVMVDLRTMAKREGKLQKAFHLSQAPSAFQNSIQECLQIRQCTLHVVICKTDTHVMRNRWTMVMFCSNFWTFHLSWLSMHQKLHCLVWTILRSFFLFHVPHATRLEFRSSDITQRSMESPKRSSQRSMDIPHVMHSDHGGAFSSFHADDLFFKGFHVLQVEPKSIFLEMVKLQEFAVGRKSDPTGNSSCKVSPSDNKELSFSRQAVFKEKPSLVPLVCWKCPCSDMMKNGHLVTKTIQRPVVHAKDVLHEDHKDHITFRTKGSLGPSVNIFCSRRHSQGHLVHVRSWTL